MAKFEEPLEEEIEFNEVEELGQDEQQEPEAAKEKPEVVSLSSFLCP